MAISNVSATRPISGYPAQSGDARQSARMAPPRSAGAADDTADPLVQLQRQLQTVMREIKRVNESSMEAKDKAQALQNLNAQAMQIQGQIQKIQNEKLRKLQGSM